LHSGVTSHRYYAGKTNSLVIQSDESRKQVANKETCYQKLVGMLTEIYKSTVPGETSEEQKEKVKELRKRSNEHRLLTKKAHASKKSGRSRSSND
jgi:peptidyl-tRNA hydrolase ICT1